MIKYKDIPKFTSQGVYCIDCSLESLEWRISRYTEQYKIELNPDFQRGHVWSEDQQIKFIEFLISGGYSGKDIYINCIGWMHGYKGPMVLVDGLQRLTAALRFVKNEIKAFGHYYKDFDFIPDQIGFKIHINDLESRREVLNWYIQLNEGGTVHTKKEINRVKDLLKKEIS